jgi:hypothetical protein
MLAPRHWHFSIPHVLFLLLARDSGCILLARPIPAINALPIRTHVKFRCSADSGTKILSHVKCVSARTIEMKNLIPAISRILFLGATTKDWIFFG